ncbi:Cof-type HAD-IIB family hydrolase [Entomospira nematocerorum]|uniref:HAD family phosphatase n=1 Tax=Entomospira nematocerorum TaxID=2719987 RepID=A0A968GC73_9SPIO|nr:Cof-type HAD-IIB family hydrolase [Entomospira nematocera]NIZ47114.1 HAD family phosphatase [Entomospira nematocera]WDI34342.1 Cof-type HAD-IIB family hydrolase [Entomospira nematocera]
MYKIIFTDLDGTLLPSNKKMTSYTKEVIHAVRSMGIKFILASGRSITSMRNFHKELLLNEPIISYNGAYIEHLGEEIYYHALDKAMAEKLLQFAVENHLYFHFYNKDQLTTLDFYIDHPELLSYSERNGLIPVGIGIADVDFSQVTKWMFVEQNRQKLEFIASQVQGLLGAGANMSFTSDIFFEIYSDVVNKGNAAHYIMDMYGLKAEESISFGDNHNDIELVSMAHLGVAMKNSPDALKNIAMMESQYTSDEDGVAKILEELFLKK